MSDQIVPMDNASEAALRALIRSVAQATVELVAERIRGCDSRPEVLAQLLMSVREPIADEITEATMECALEDPDSEVHAVRGKR